MIALAAGVGAVKAGAGFVAGNWRWLVPAAAFVALGAYAVDRTVRLSNLRAEVAQGEADRANAILARKERDRVLGASIEADRAEAEARADRAIIPQFEVIRREKVVIPTVDTPAMRAADDGLLGLGFHRATRSPAGQPDQAPAAAGHGAGEAQ